MTDDQSPPRLDGKCNGRLRQSDGLCRQPAGWGTSHPGYGQCKLHGGSMPNNVAAAQMEQAQDILDHERARNPLAGEPMNTGPGEALLWRVRVYAGEVKRLDERIAEIEAEDLVWGTTETTIERSSEGVVIREKESARLNVWLVLRERRERQLQSACEAALHAGVEQAMVELARDQIAFMKRVILEALHRRADIPPDDPWVAAELPGIIRELSRR